MVDAASPALPGISAPVGVVQFGPVWELATPAERLAVLALASEIANFPLGQCHSFLAEPWASIPARVRQSIIEGVQGCQFIRLAVLQGVE